MAPSALPFSHNDMDENKYAKKQPVFLEVAGKGCEAFSAISAKNVFTSKGAAALLSNPPKLYMAFLLVCFAIYNRLGGSLTAAKTVDQFAFISTTAEGVALITLQLKIGHQGSVSGISATTLGMYAIVYLSRQVLLLPAKGASVESWATEVLQIPSILMVFGLLRSVLVTYRKSYQVELDVVSLKHLVPGYILLAVLLCPSFIEGPMYSHVWAAYLYLDVLALLPQVIMMAQGGSKVRAPISNFVAATAFSRVVDMWFWCADWGAGLKPQMNFYLPGSFHYSAWVIVFFHVLSLVLVADFMYYYIKARCSGSSSSDDGIMIV